MTNQTILFVDDEPNVLRALKRLCSRESFKTLTTHSGLEALEVMKRETVDLVVSDLRMPEMDGVELFAEIDRLYPEVPRVMLSGNADLPAVVTALNEGKISYYCDKPWLDDRFRFVLRGLLNQRALEQKYKTLLETVREQNEELTRQSDKISEQVDLRNRFFAIMSHEIRTPLNGVHGILQILISRLCLDHESKNLANIALTSSTHLSRIVNEILDFSKIESGDMQLELRTFSVRKMIQELFELMLPIAESKNIRLKWNDDLRDEDCFYEGDNYRIRQVMINLIGNAIKFTETGWVEISTPSLIDKDFRFCIKDTGIGIPSDTQELLFQEFKMLSSSHARRFGGTGLGLNICMRLVGLMNGDIKVESQPGQGSMFTVHIPLNRTDDTNSLSEVGSVKFDLSRKSLLVVDDNETNRIIVEQMLEEHGVKVFHAENGEQALALLADDSINSVLDFIMMDISMPVMSGIEVVQIIRAQNLVDSNLPIIAMTAHVQPDEQQTFYDAGMDGFLGKPFQISELIQVLRVHDQEFNHECFLRLKSDTGKTGIDRLVASFRRDAEKRLATLKVSYATENWKEFSAQSHALGSSAGMFGTLRLYRICRRVEFAYQKDETAELKDLAVSLIGLVIPGVEKVESWHKAAYGRDQIL